MQSPQGILCILCKPYRQFFLFHLPKHRNADEFCIGMGIMAVAAKCFQDVRIITFELMTNHLHIMAAGDELRLRQMFGFIKKLLMRKRGSRSFPYHPLSRIPFVQPTGKICTTGRAKKRVCFSISESLVVQALCKWPFYRLPLRRVYPTTRTIPISCFIIG